MFLNFHNRYRYCVLLKKGNRLLITGTLGRHYHEAKDLLVFKERA